MPRQRPNNKPLKYSGFWLITFGEVLSAICALLGSLLAYFIAIQSVTIQSKENLDLSSQIRYAEIVDKSVEAVFACELNLIRAQQSGDSHILTAGITVLRECIGSLAKVQTSLKVLKELLTDKKTTESFLRMKCLRDQMTTVKESLKNFKPGTRQFPLDEIYLELTRSILRLRDYQDYSAEDIHRSDAFNCEKINATI